MIDGHPIRKPKSEIRNHLAAVHDDVAHRATGQEVRCNDLTVMAGYEDLLRANGLDSLDAMFAVSSGESLCKPGLGSWRERIRLTLTIEPPHSEPQAWALADSPSPEPRAWARANSRWPATVYLKRFTNPSRQASRAVHRSGTGASSTAGVEWVWLNRLSAEGIACPRPIAFGEDMAGSRERRSALLIEAVPGKSLERWLNEWGEADRHNVRRLIGPTAAFIASFHSRGYMHRDLYLAHLFFDPEETCDQSLHLIDLARVIRPAGGHLRWIVKDLASLSFSAPAHLISKTDRLRWLKRYLHVSKLEGPGRQLVYRIIGKADWIARHERRRQVRFRSRSVF